MYRTMIGAALMAVGLSGCAGVTFQNGHDDAGVNFYDPMPALVIAPDAKCNMVVSVLTLPGKPRTARFNSGLGKSDVGLTLGDGGVLKSTTVKSEGQVSDLISLANLAGIGAVAAADGGGNCDKQPVILPLPGGIDPDNDATMDAVNAAFEGYLSQ